MHLELFRLFLGYTSEKHLWSVYSSLVLYYIKAITTTTTTTTTTTIIIIITITDKAIIITH